MSKGDERAQQIYETIGVYLDTRFRTTRIFTHSNTCCFLAG